MIIELNPLKWGKKSEVRAAASSTDIAPAGISSAPSVQPAQPEQAKVQEPPTDAGAEDVSVKVASQILKIPGASTMSTAATPLTIAALSAAPAKEGKFHSILDHVKAFFGIAIKDIEIYTPAAASLAEVIFPQYTGAIEADKAILTGAATTIKNTVLTIQQKYSEAVPSDATNAQKLEDALAIITPTLVPTLNSLKVPVPSDLQDITDKINATVAILKNYSVPVATPTAQGTVAS